jgi:hypothetical protein
MQRWRILSRISLGIAATMRIAQVYFAVAHSQTQTQSQPLRTRCSQRVHMPEVQIVSPNGVLKFAIQPNAERLTFSVTLQDTKIIETSPIVMMVDGLELSSGVVFENTERYELNALVWPGQLRDQPLQRRQDYSGPRPEFHARFSNAP